MHQLITRAATVVGGAALLSPFTNSHTPAHAATTEETVYAYQGADYAGIIPSSGVGYVVDKECDGHAVRVKVWRKRWAGYYHDTNGCKAGAGHFDVGYVTAMKVEERQDDGTWVAGATVAVQ